MIKISIELNAEERELGLLIQKLIEQQKEIVDNHLQPEQRKDLDELLKTIKISHSIELKEIYYKGIGDGVKMKQ